jgi:hypothetical protein
MGKSFSPYYQTHRETTRMTSHRELLHSYTQPLSDIPVLDLPDDKAEPDDSDFAELDAMIAKASYTSPQTKNKANLKVFQEKVSETCRAQSFKLKEGIIVWLQVECKCGSKMPLLFQRNMEKWQFRNSFHWKTVQEFEQGLPDGLINNAIIRREVCFCGNCTPIVGEVGEFKDMVKGEKE